MTDKALPSDSKYTFAEAICHRLKGQAVEVFCGDTGETRHFSETESTQKNIIRGIVEDAVGDCLILSVDKQGLKATVYLNGWTIKSVVPIRDPLFVKDVYNDEEEFGLAKAAFSKGRK